jgi:hypothetical protein
MRGVRESKFHCIRCVYKHESHATSLIRTQRLFHHPVCLRQIKTSYHRPHTSDSRYLCDQLHGESIRSSASQEIPCILWNPAVDYRVHTSPPLTQFLIFHIVPGVLILIPCIIDYVEINQLNAPMIRVLRERGMDCSMA